MAKDTKLWPLEPHTVGKHKVLREYLNAWLPIMGTWNGRILIIDGFAGPGEYEGGEEGSPIVALNALSEHVARHTITAEVVYVFVEENQKRADHLRGLLENKRAQLPANCVTEVMCGRFDETMTGLLNDIDKQNKRLAPAFVMIDPFGVSDTPMSVIERILKNERSEVYVSLMYEAINRHKSTPELEVHLDRLFGCGEWRDGMKIEERAERKAFFYGLYDAQLRRSGAEQVVRFELFEGKRLIYAIFFGTHHTKGSNRIKEAIWKIAPFGDFAFHGTVSDQLTLDIGAPDFQPLRALLTQRFRDRDWSPIEGVENFGASDRTDYYVSQLRKGALVPLEVDGHIEVDESSRKRTRTYPPGTRIRFK